MDIMPIGSIRTPFDDPAGIPIQPAGARGVEGRIELDREYRAGLKQLHGTPLIDIKRYVPEFDSQVDIRTGRLERVGQNVSTARPDGRFQKG